MAKARRLKEKYGAKFEFLEGWGANQKSFVREGSVGCYGFFLQPYIRAIYTEENKTPFYPRCDLNRTRTILFIRLRPT